MNKIPLNSDLINIVRSYLLPLRDNTYFKDKIVKIILIMTYSLYHELHYNYHFFHESVINNLHNTKINTYLVNKDRYWGIESKETDLI